MHVHVFQHVPFEGLGSIGHWATDRGARVTWTRFHEDPAIPPLDDVDLLVAMGGPMSVNDERDYPWLADEKARIREAITRRIPTLGVCLGAQLIASALGSRVYRQPDKEIGWFPIQAADDAIRTLDWPREITVFHWHGETFDLPARAVRLASSPACLNQAFCVDDAAIGLQFHLEATPGSVAQLAAHCRDELVPGRYIQHEAEIVGATASACAATNALLDRLLDRLVRARTIVPYSRDSLV
jgi:GMP synthase-like glutamine amidotransferase